jgi:hypothetical protein
MLHACCWFPCEVDALVRQHYKQTVPGNIGKAQVLLEDGHTWSLTLVKVASLSHPARQSVHALSLLP